MMDTNPHACGVDDIACSSTPTMHAFGVDDGPLISFLLSVLFPTWVTSAECYRVTFA